MTRTEELVYKLCNKTFLSLWSFANPLRNKGKELCDILIICEPDIVIFSVKEINIKNSGNEEVDIERWLSRAVHSSVVQIYGAERFINKVEKITLNDRITQINIPKNINWKIHRVAVAFGRGEKFPAKFGDFGQGFVHVFDEKSVEIILKELDTIKDFINYLTDKEEFINSTKYPITCGEEDLLAYYLSNNFSIPKLGNYIVFKDDIYDGLINDPVYKKIIQELKISYSWDRLIEHVVEDYKNENMINQVSRENLELIMRQMAREDRNTRKILSEQFLDFIGYKSNSKANARIVQSLENRKVLYLFLISNPEDREGSMQELILRSIVIRSKFDCRTIIGIATERYSPKGYSISCSYSNYPEITEEFKLRAKIISDQLGYFKNA